jgi:hypothetical protein
MPKNIVTDVFSHILGKTGLNYMKGVEYGINRSNWVEPCTKYTERGLK